MRRDVIAADAPTRAGSKSSKPSPKHGQGSVCVRWVRCGRSWCRCMSGGPKHGPYYAQYWWHAGRPYKRYVRQDQAEQVIAICSARRQAERGHRAQADAARRAWRGVRDWMREFERDEG